MQITFVYIRMHTHTHTPVTFKRFSLYIRAMRCKGTMSKRKRTAQMWPLGELFWAKKRFFYLKTSYISRHKASDSQEYVDITMRSTDMSYRTLLLLLTHVSRVQLCATPQTAAQQAPVPGILQARTLEWVIQYFRRPQIHVLWRILQWIIVCSLIRHLDGPWEPRELWGIRQWERVKNPFQKKKKKRAGMLGN